MKGKNGDDHALWITQYAAVLLYDANACVLINQKNIILSNNIEYLNMYTSFFIGYKILD